jgi:alkanesulfonate monooxygenase SsuD/methylene tetrahydromethanopterin reductase-like flavin-dependent oxidoreductase (luciferase family)
MDFGSMTAKVDEIGYITRAENLGYRAIRLGTGVNVPGLRLAPAAANGIATINRLAPGRCFMSLGTGHTGMRLLGQRPMRLGPFREYVQIVRGLLRGEDVEYALNGETHRIRFQMREHRFIDWLSEAPPAIRHQRLHGSHYTFVDPEEARFLSADLIKATCLSGTPPELVEQIKTLEGQGLRQIMLYPPLNRQYRVVEDFAEKVMARR